MIDTAEGYELLSHAVVAGCGAAVERGWGLCGFAGLAVGAEGGAVGAAEDGVQVRLHGESATGGDFADRQIGLLQHAADFFQLPSPDGRRHAFLPYLAEAYFEKTARDVKRVGKTLHGQSLGRGRQTLTGIRVDDLLG